MVETSTRLTFLCHAATGATRRGAFPTGDDPLAPRALQAASGLAGRLGRPGRGWTSPTECAVATARALDLRCSPDARLRDCDYGQWAGRTLADVEASDFQGLGSWFTDPAARPHGGEALTMVAARMADWLGACAAGGGRMLAVTHPLPIRVAAVLALGCSLEVVWRLDVTPLSLTRLTAHKGRWRLASLNERG
jgi:broad specificity phosphatase PhoE